MRVFLFVASFLVAGLAFGDNHLVGVWTLTIDTPRGINHPVLTVVQTDQGYKGNMVGRRGETVIPSIAFDGSKFSFPMKVSMPFGEFDMSYAGVVEADEMRGEVRGPRGGIPFSGKKAP